MQLKVIHRHPNGDKAGSNEALRIVVSGASKSAVDLVPIVDQLGAPRYGDISTPGIVLIGKRNPTGAAYLA